MADIEEAFKALEHLDEEGLKALRLAGALWQEVLGEATSRAEKAEWLLERLHSWAAGWGLVFDLSKADARWEAQHERPSPVLGPRCQVLLAEQGQEFRKLRARLDKVLDEREQAEIRAEAADDQLKQVRGEAARHV